MPPGGGGRLGGGGRRGGAAPLFGGRAGVGLSPSEGGRGINGGASSPGDPSEFPCADNGNTYILTRIKRQAIIEKVTVGTAEIGSLGHLF